MDTIEIDKLKYPIGKFKAPETFSKELSEAWIREIEELPFRLRSVVSKLNDEQLSTPYRDGGWTVRQVVHHLADSHLNSYIRFKLAMTEDHPTIKPYEEDRWAELEEAKHAPVEISLVLIEALHARWVLFLKNLTEEDLMRTFYHPESKRDYQLRTILALYAWHGNHHLAHITSLMKRNEWS